MSVKIKPADSGQLYQVAHCNPDGKTGVAQAQIWADSEDDLEVQFARLFPNRVIVAISGKTDAESE